MKHNKKAPALEDSKGLSTQLTDNSNYTPNVVFTLVSSVKTLTKKYLLNGDQVEVKTAANMYEGEHKQITVSTASAFAEVLQTLKPNQALVHGVAPLDRPNILSKTKWYEAGQPADTVTRSNTFFSWPSGGGVMMLDFDYHGIDRTRDETIAIIKSVIPALADAAYVWWCSSSSYIYNGDTEINGLRGQRLYIFVKDATDIKRAGEVLFDRLWIAGQGFYEVSAAGSLLTRCIIDGSVWQPSRLDFAAGADCIAPLEQKRPAPFAHEGGLLDTRVALPDLTGAERAELEVLQRKAKQEMQPEADAERYLYIEERAATDLAAKGIADPTDDDIEVAKQAITRALETNTLTGDFVVTLGSGEAVTVGEMLDDPTKYHQSTTKDPLEPDYDGGRTVGKVFLFNGRPTLYSMAHGGKTYRLIRQPRRIEHARGSTTETVNNTLQLLRELPDFFDMGEQMVTIDNGKPRALTQDLLPYTLGSIIQYWQWTPRKNGEMVQVNIDPPMQVIRAILAMGTARRLKPLKAVITAPTITAGDHVLSRGGYDEKTELYLAMDDMPPPVPPMVEQFEAPAALADLMRPFDTFPFASALDRSVCLAAVLTSIIRPVVSTAPAIAFDAPKQGTGKTYLAECIGALGTGEKPAALPPVDNRSDDEVRKRLFSELLRGSRSVLWDNIMGVFDSGSLAAFLTAETFADRVLGKSETRDLPNRALFLMTGNNLQLAGELPRRVLICRLDSGLENPTMRRFTTSPLNYIIANRQQLVRAGLTLIRSYLQSDTHQLLGGASPDKLASYDEWDTLARQVVAWVATFDDQYTDPKKSIDDGISKDPDQEMLYSLLHELQVCFGDRWFTAKDVLDAMTGADFTVGRRDLADAVRDITGTNSNQIPTSRSMGRVLTFRRDRIANGLKLTHQQQGKKAALYRIEHVTG